MDLGERLKEAGYVHRGDDAPYTGNQCGFNCDHSKLMNNDDSPRPCYRVCDKFKIRVSDYDSCKYYCDDDFVANCAGLMKALGYKTEAEKKAASNKQPEVERSGTVWFFLIIAVLVYMIVKIF